MSTADTDPRTLRTDVDAVELRLDGNTVRLGSGSSATGTESVVFGKNATDAGNTGAVIAGSGAAVTGNYATALGLGTSAGTNAVAVGGSSGGLGAKALASSSVAFGAGASVPATATSSAAMGTNATIGANATTSFAFGAGSNVAASCTDSVAAGPNAYVTASNCLVLGQHVGNGSGTAVNTNIGIGTTAPTQALHVVGTALVSTLQTLNPVGVAYGGTGVIASVPILQTVRVASTPTQWSGTQVLAVTTVAAFDTTIPLAGEFATVLDTPSITPKSTTSVMHIEACLWGACGTGGQAIMLVLHDVTSGVTLHASGPYLPAATAGRDAYYISCSVVSGSLAARTYRLGVGVSHDTFYVNGVAGAAWFNTASKTTLEVTEYAS